MSPRILETTWYGGQTVADAPGAGPRGVLARTPGGAAFAHRARVWREPDGTVRGEWFDNGLRGDIADQPLTTGEWRPFTGERIPAALLEQAEAAGGASSAGGGS
jgi:hypothetical protein